MHDKMELIEISHVTVKNQIFM